MRDLALNPDFQVGRISIKKLFSNHLEAAFWPLVLQSEIGAP